MALLRAGLAALVLLLSPVIALAGELPRMTVWKDPSCGCCGNWVQHMREAGFDVTVRDREDMDQLKRLAGVPEGLQSCHTARVGNYMVEGHVPAADVKRLLAEQPDAHGLAVPGMPSGSPGMENGEFDRYDVLLFQRGGNTKVFSSHN